MCTTALCWWSTASRASSARSGISFDPTHPRYTPDHPFAGTIGSFYRFVDDQLFELLELVDDDTIVAVVSAGGAQALLGELALNEWLIAQGDLALHDDANRARQP